MKLTMRSDDLRSVVGWVVRLRPPRPAFPVLGGVLFEATEDVRLTAFDFETAGTVGPSATVLEPGRCLVSGHLLAAVCKTLRPADEVDVVADDSSMRITAGRSLWTLPLMEAEDYPTLPTGGEVVGEVDATVLRDLLARVSPASGGPKTKPEEMRGTVRLTSNGEVLRMAATDRYRAAVGEAGWHPAPGGEPVDLVCAADLLKVALDGASGPVTLRASGGGVAVAVGTRSVVGRLVDSGRFPTMTSLRGMFDVLVATTVVVNTAEMIAAVQRATTVQGDFRQVWVEFGPDGGWVRASGSDEAGSDQDFPVESFEGEPIEVGVNADYLTDGLGACGAAATLALQANPRRPLLIQPDGEAGGYRYLLMTMNLEKLR